MEIKNEIIEKIDTIKGPVLEVLNNIIDREYVYSVDNVVDILKIQRVYIQDEFVSKTNTLKLGRSFKLYCKSCMGDLKSYRGLLQELGISLKYNDFMSLNSDTVELIQKANLTSYKLSRKILISRIELMKLIESKFVEEFEYEDKNNKYYQKYSKINSKHAELILASGLKDQGDLKDLYKVRTELQVYRRIRKGDSDVLAKYVIPSKSDAKKGMARYLLASDIPVSKLQLARETILDR